MQDQALLKKAAEVCELAFRKSELVNGAAVLIKDRNEKPVVDFEALCRHVLFFFLRQEERGREWRSGGGQGQECEARR
jgi:hypothetical protein